MNEQHEGRDIAPLRSLRPDGPVGRLVCLDCDVIIGPLALCGRPIRAGRPCTVGVRRDLGHTVCWSHGEGAGRTNIPRHRRAS
jgi:hypothetical protein